MMCTSIDIRGNPYKNFPSLVFKIVPQVHMYSVLKQEHEYVAKL